MVERGTSPKSLMEGLKGGQELGSRLTVCVCLVLFGQKSVPLGFVALLQDQAATSQPQ